MSGRSPREPRLRSPRSALELVFPRDVSQARRESADAMEAAEPASDGSRRLPIGPRRWLLIDSSTAAEDRAALQFDVTGKWQAIVLPRVDGEALLRAEIDLERALAGRASGVASLHGVPVVIARTAAELEIWTTSSYLAWLIDALGWGAPWPGSAAATASAVAVASGHADHRSGPDS